MKCNKCEKDLPEEHFSESQLKRKDNGKRCKKCISEYNRANYNKKRDKIRKQQNDWRKANKDYQKEYYQANKEYYKDYMKKRKNSNEMSQVQEESKKD